MAIIRKVMLEAVGLKAKSKVSAVPWVTEERGTNLAIPWVGATDPMAIAGVVGMGLTAATETATVVGAVHRQIRSN